jgi:hypothetical protein
MYCRSYTSTTLGKKWCSTFEPKTGSISVVCRSSESPVDGGLEGDRGSEVLRRRELPDVGERRHFESIESSRQLGHDSDDGEVELAARHADDTPCLPPSGHVPRGAKALNDGRYLPGPGLATIAAHAIGRVDGEERRERRGMVPHLAGLPVGAEVRCRDHALHGPMLPHRRGFLLMPVQVVRTSRRLFFWLLAWNPWQAVFLRGFDQLRQPLPG